MPTVLPHDEAARLIALHSYKLLDTDPSAEFDAVVERAADIFDAPIGALSLVDEDRQWFKAAVGLQVSETPRAVSFCAHAMLGDRPMVVQDARLDPRFARNPLVTGPLSIRFYIGAPLIGRGGVRLGSLCAIKPEPRQATDLECRQLASLARLAVARMEMHRTAQLLAADAGR